MDEKEQSKAIPFIVKNDWVTNTTCGAYNGYVAIPPTNKYYGKRQEEINETISIHGEVSYSEYVTNRTHTVNGHRKIKPERVGAITALLNNIEIISKDTKIPSDWFIIGFDTLHDGDNKRNWNKSAVIKEKVKLNL